MAKGVVCANHADTGQGGLHFKGAIRKNDVTNIIKP